MADDLGRWAAERAPDLLRRAEEEAVVLIRDALVRAAVGERDRSVVTAAPAQPAQPARAPRSAAPAAPDAGHLLWAYCILEADAHMPRDLVGVDASAPVERMEAGGVAALVSRVPSAEFGAEPLRANLNDLGWLERVARAHEAVLEQVLAGATIVPLRICTLYESEESVRGMLAHERDAFSRALAHLAGRQEWGVKVLADPERIAAVARARSSEVKAYEDEIATRTGGGAYMLRRRLERHVRELSDAAAAEIADDVHLHLRDWASDAVTRPPQNRDLSGHEGEMLLNAAYLVEEERVDGLHRLVGELEDRHRDVGVRLDLTGPWPPYNFVPGQGAGVIA